MPQKDYEYEVKSKGLKDAEFSRFSGLFMQLVRHLDPNRRQVPDFFSVFLDGTVRRELAHADDIHDLLGTSDCGWPHYTTIDIGLVKGWLKHSIFPGVPPLRRVLQPGTARRRSLS